MSSFYTNYLGLFQAPLMQGTISGSIVQTNAPADRRILLDQYTGEQQTTRAINATTRDYIVNPNSGQLYGMNEIDNKVYLAIATVYNSSAASGFGQQFTQQKTVASNVQNVFTNLVNQALADVISDGSITILQILTTSNKDAVVLQVKYINNHTGQVVDNFLPGDAAAATATIIKPTVQLALAPFTPFVATSLPNCLAWWNASLDVSFNQSDFTDNVVTWGDASGNGHTLIPNDGYVGFNPVDFTYGLNRWSTVTLTTSNYLSGTISSAQPFTFYAVLAISNGSCSILYNNASGTQGTIVGVDSSGHIYIGKNSSTPYLLTVNTYVNTVVIIQAIFNGSQSILSVLPSNMRTETITGSTVGVSLAGTMYLGSNGLMNSINGDIAEAIIYNIQAQTGVQSNQVINYLQGKYNISSV